MREVAAAMIFSRVAALLGVAVPVLAAMSFSVPLCRFDGRRRAARQAPSC